MFDDDEVNVRDLSADVDGNGITSFTSVEQEMFRRAVLSVDVDGIDCARFSSVDYEVTEEDTPSFEGLVTVIMLRSSSVSAWSGR